MNDSIEIKKNAYYEPLADILFPESSGDKPRGEMLAADEYEALYPPRRLPDNAAVTRLGPSPTGFIHLGNLFMATVNRRLATQSSGVFFLRIEDTDQKREVEGAVEGLIKSLAYFGIDFDEGVSLEAENGEYGPYFQSERTDIYKAFVRKLVAEGKAYPCFLTEDEIDEIRTKQEAEKRQTGIYGDYARWRGADLQQIREKVAAKEPYVIRLFADYEKDRVSSDSSLKNNAETITVNDGIRGDITLPKNIMDVVIMKKDGLPTYHFAHVIDDHFMRTTHVVRGEEWLSSLPVHIALFDALGFKPPKYCHTALLMKTENGVKRKLSKRKDPELALSYYMAEGYHPLAINEYMLTIINSNYEEWRLANPDLDNSEFIITIEKMGASGILFDLDKLQNISRDTLVRIKAAELSEFMLDWARRENPEAAAAFERDRETLIKALDIGRSGEKPRKDLSHAVQIFDFISYFFDEFFILADPLPENVTPADAKELLAGYLSGYDHADDRERWFEKIRELSLSHGFAAKPKDFKNSPDMYKGHVGDVSAVIRRALTGRLNAPDIYEIQQIMGDSKTRSRIEAAIQN